MLRPPSISNGAHPTVRLMAAATSRGGGLDNSRDGKQRSAITSGSTGSAPFRTGSVSHPEIGPQGVGDREHASLCFVVGYTQEGRHLPFTYQMESGPSATQPVQAQREHEAPHARCDRTPMAGLPKHTLAFDPPVESGDEQHRYLGHVLREVHDRFGHSSLFFGGRRKWIVNPARPLDEVRKAAR